MSSWSILSKRLHQMRTVDDYRTKDRHLLMARIKLVRMHNLKVKETKRLQYLLSPVMMKKTSLETRLMR